MLKYSFLHFHDLQAEIDHVVATELITLMVLEPHQRLLDTNGVAGIRH